MALINGFSLVKVKHWFEMSTNLVSVLHVQEAFILGKNMVMLTEKIQTDFFFFHCTMTNNVSPFFPSIILESSATENADFAVVLKV